MSGKRQRQRQKQRQKKTKTKIYSLLVLSTNWSLVCWEKSRIRQPDRQTKMEMLNAQNQAEETDTYVEPWYRTEVRFFRFLIYSEFHQPTCCWKWDGEPVRYSDCFSWWLWDHWSPRPTFGLLSHSFIKWDSQLRLDHRRYCFSKNAAKLQNCTNRSWKSKCKPNIGSGTDCLLTNRPRELWETNSAAA